MDKVIRYREAVKSTLAYLLRGGYGKTQKLRNEALYDEQNNRYAVIVTGKDAGTHVHELIAQIDLVADKVIIQLNTSDVDLAEGLTKYGVDANDIVDAQTVDV
jgi:hypothetical protein